jgi:hypothetical protein
VHHERAAGELPFKTVGEEGVDLERDHPDSAIEQFPGQGSSPGADFDDRLSGLSAQSIDDPAYRRFAAKEVLSQARARGGSS